MSVPGYHVITRRGHGRLSYVRRPSLSFGGLLHVYATRLMVRLFLGSALACSSRERQHAAQDRGFSQKDGTGVVPRGTWTGVVSDEGKGAIYTMAEVVSMSAGLGRQATARDQGP